MAPLSTKVVRPPGSADIEALFKTFFTDNELNYTATPFDGRSDYGPFLDVGIPAGGLFAGAEGIKTKEEVPFFRGEADVAYDACYHAACDNVTNLALDAFEVNTKAIAFSVATYAESFDSLPPPNITVTKRSMLVSKEKMKEKKKGAGRRWWVYA
jgi:carboxypeptidase Q